MVVNAKAGLLNLFAKLSEEKDPRHPDRNWFSYVEEIEEIRKERFIAQVQSEMGASVRKIRDHLDTFPNYENRRLFNHLIAVFFVHRFTGGTRPMDIHEYLALAYPERELGYRPVVV